jgi:2'-hydroxyisoflavone reductase
MRILLIGGTRFVGLAIAREALSRGHDVTIFHRGTTAPVGLEGATFIIGDRDEDDSVLAEGQWDATVDVCAYRPHQVDRLFDALAARGGQQVYISTVSVYEQNIPAGSDESAELASLAPLEGLDPAACDITGETYGPLKVMCENRVQELYTSPIIIRPTYVVGPDDYTMRFPTWVQRIAAGGVVQAPEPRDNAMQYVDARDQAAFVITLLEQGTVGTFHTPAPAITFEEMLVTIVDTVGPQGTTLDWVTPSDADSLQPLDFPLWAGTEAVGMMAMDSSAAINAGLSFRPLAATVSDTLEWLSNRA